MTEKLSNKEQILKLLREEYGSICDKTIPIPHFDLMDTYNEGEWLSFPTNQLPQLVLGVMVDNETSYPPYFGSEFKDRDEIVKKKLLFKEEHQFWKLSNQTGGMICNHVYIYGKIITPKADMWSKINILQKLFLSSCLGGGLSNYNSFEKILSYRGALKGIIDTRLDCNHSYQYLEEACYPIDFSAESAEILTGEYIPAESKYWVQEMRQEQKEEAKKHPFRYFHRDSFVNRMQFFILGENCD
jgi:hypothetical protein